MTQSFTVKNYKGVREITLQPEGSLVVIAGANGAGKSSFIDGICELFDARGTKLTPKPIRDGEDEARAEFVDTNLGIRITRTWKKDDGGKLEVVSLDGTRFPKPSDVVAKLTGGVIFDPVTFLNLDARKQRDALLAKVSLPFDLDQLEREKVNAEDMRREAGRDVKRLEGALASAPEVPAGTPTEEVTSLGLLADLQQAREWNTSISQAESQANAMQVAIEQWNAEEQRLLAALEHARAQRDSIVAGIEQVREHAAQTPVDTSTIEAQLASVDAVNANVRAARDRLKLEGELNVARIRQSAQQAIIDRIEQQKRDGLAAANFPVPGLGVDETGITFDGVPFGQVNTAARLQVALAVATADNPEIKLVIIRTGDMLDDISLERVRAIADQRGYTVLMERDRDGSRQVGFTIREGQLDD